MHLCVLVLPTHDPVRVTVDHVVNTILPCCCGQYLPCPVCDLPPPPFKTVHTYKAAVLYSLLLLFVPLTPSSTAIRLVGQLSSAGAWTRSTTPTVLSQLHTLALRQTETVVQQSLPPPQQPHSRLPPLLLQRARPGHACLPTPLVFEKKGHTHPIKM